ncbi:MAG TPA: ankyrin repeat domain-containing protein [Rhodocyclaceae bacterium]
MRSLLLAGLVFLTPYAYGALPDPAAFGVAMELGNVDKARDWLDQGLPPDFVADRIGSGLMIAAWEGNLPLMEVFVQRGADVNFTNAMGEQALQLAAWKGKLEAVQWLLAHGASVNRQGKEWSALHYAVFAGNGEIAKLLLQRGADVNGQAPNGSSVLMMAAREGREDLAKALLAAGADPMLKNENGDTALSWAMRQGNLKIAKLVSSPNQFAKAVKAPPESFGTAMRSVPPPAGISEILRQIRLAEAQGLPTEELRARFHAAVDAYKRNEPPPRAKALVVQPRVPKGLVITAQRQGSGERAEVVYGDAAKPATSPAVAAAAAGAVAEDPMELLRQLRLADAAGKPTTELRKRFLEAVRRYKGQQ